MEFTGERYVPGIPGLEELYVEHMSRYVFAGPLAAGGRVLDLGCGCGYGAAYLASCGAASVVGVDTSEEALRFAESHYGRPGLSFVAADARCLAVGTGFDLITCFEMIEHVEHAGEVLDEVCRVLGAGGVFLVSTPNKANYVAGGPDGGNPFHVREYHREEFEHLLGSKFPHVELFSQAWCEGMATKPMRRQADQARQQPDRVVSQTRKLPDQMPDSEPAGPEARYFIAVCTGHDVLGDLLPRLPHYIVADASMRYDGLKAAMARLQDEFDNRGRWAQGLDGEVRARDAMIRRLQAEVEHLKSECARRWEI